MKVRLWFINQTDKARHYAKIPYSRFPADSDKIWVPMSLIEHTTKWPPKPPELWAEHIVTVPDWFAEKNSL